MHIALPTNSLIYTSLFIVVLLKLGKDIRNWVEFIEEMEFGRYQGKCSHVNSDEKVFSPATFQLSCVYIPWLHICHKILLNFLYVM